MPGKVHTQKFDDCVKKVSAKGTVDNPYAVCMKSLGPAKAIAPGHQHGRDGGTAGSGHAGGVGHTHKTPTA